MITRPARTVTVSTTPTDIRKTPAFANDPAAYPVTYTVVTVPSGGGNVQFVPASNSVYADGEGVLLTDNPFTDDSQAVKRYMIASAGTVNVLVVDHEA